MAIKEVWQNRWKALDEELSRMNSEYGDLGNALPRYQSFQALTQGLQNLARNMYQKYSEWFTNGVKPPDKYSPEYVLRNLLDQVAYDMTIIQYAAAQRLKTEHLSNRLAKADLLANDALQKAVSRGFFLEDTGFTALTFFTRVPRVRVIPYATVAIIAIPFTALEVDEDMLAAAHEVGHYVYWHGKFPKPPWQTVNVENDKKEKWLRDWLEEVFADVFSVWVAGPVSGLSIQDILVDNPFEEFCANDGHHPATIIRPNIYTDTIAPQYDSWRTHLIERWEEEKNKVPPKFIKDVPRPGRSSLPANEIFTFTLELVSIALEQLGVPLAPWHLPGDLPEPTLINKTQDDKTLYDAFSRYLQSLKDPIPDDPNLLNVIDLKLSGPGFTGHLRTLAQILDDVPKSELEWEYVISAGGWASKGPEQNFPPWPP